MIRPFKSQRGKLVMHTTPFLLPILDKPYINVFCEVLLSNWTNCPITKRVKIQKVANNNMGNAVQVFSVD
jgi:hypothetical protein